MGNGDCNNCTNSENDNYNKYNTENLDIIKNDSYISFHIDETKEPTKLEENNININQLINISKQSDNEKKEEEQINLQNIKQNDLNDYNSGELEEKIEDNTENDNKDVNLENCKIPKKEMPSTKIENKTRNIVNDFVELNNDNNATNNMNNNTIQTKSNQIENNNDIIENYSQKSEEDEEKNHEEIQEENKEDYKEDNNNKEKNLNINDINHKSNAIELNIYNIFPKNKLMQMEDNSILCHGFLEKIIKIPSKNKFIYNERFCILTKKNFAYYKSKENYLNLWKPLFSINLEFIKRVEQTVSDDKIFYFGLICLINDETRAYVNKINTFVNSNENNKDEFLIGFRSKNKELILKWIIILNYLIENKEQK